MSSKSPDHYTYRVTWSPEDKEFLALCVEFPSLSWLAASPELALTGIRKVVLLNSHGGNDLKWVLRELHGRTPAQLFLCNWYMVCKDLLGDIFAQADDHAGEMETSFALAQFPELVGRNADGTLTADEGRPAKSRFEAVNCGWVSITRPWHLLTTNAGVGNPHAATAEKGERHMDALVERLAQFLVELSAAEVDERFPY